MTYTSTIDAQDAIDNMDLNELRGRVLRVNLARPQKMTAAVAGNRAGEINQTPTYFAVLG